MLFKRLSLEQFQNHSQNHSELFEGLNSVYRSNRLEGEWVEQSERVYQFKELPSGIQQTILKKTQHLDLVEASQYVVKQAIVVETVWVKGKCVCACICLDEKYEDLFVMTRVLELKLRRMSDLALLRYLKWSNFRDEYYGYPLFHDRSFDSFWVFSKEDLTPLMGEFLVERVGLIKSEDSLDDYYFAPTKETSFREYLRYQLVAGFIHPKNNGQGFHGFAETVIKQYSIERLASSKSLIIRYLEQYYRDYFEMTGSKGWRVTYRTRVKIKADSQEEAMQKAREIGYDAQRAEQFYDRHSVEGVNYFIVEGVQQQQLDHKYNDYQLSYYRHVVKKHLYDYYRSIKTISSFKIFDQFGECLWSQEMKEPYMNPIPKFMKVQIEHKIKEAKLREYFENWSKGVLSQRKKVAVREKGCHADPEYVVKRVSDSLVQIRLTFTEKDSQLLEQKANEICVQKSVAEISRFQQNFYMFFSSDSQLSTLLTEHAFCQLVLKYQPFELYYVLKKLEFGLNLMKGQPEQLKLCRKKCLVQARKGVMTFEWIEALLEVSGQSKKERQRQLINRLDYQSILTLNQVALELLSEGDVSLTDQLVEREMTLDYLKNNYYKLFDLIGISATQKRFLPIIQSMLAKIEQIKDEQMLQSVFSECHDIAYVLNQITRTRLLSDQSLKLLLKNTSFSNLKRVNEYFSTLNRLNKVEFERAKKCIEVEILEQKTLTIDFLQTLNKRMDEDFYQELNLTDEGIEQCYEFLKRMQRYGSHFTLKNVAQTLGVEFFKECVAGRVEGLFQEKTFHYPKPLIGERIRHLLKATDGSVQNPKRLYNKLRKIKPVASFIEGDFDSDEMVEALHHIKMHTSNLKDLEVPLKLTAKVEAKCSPEFLVAGNASVCCMSFGNYNALTYAKEKGFGILNIYYGDRIIGNSVLWLSPVEDYLFLVLDNVEIHPNYTKYNAYIKELYLSVIDYLKEEYFSDFVVQGASYNDLDLFHVDARKGAFEKLEAIDVTLSKFYTDAHQFYFLVMDDDQQSSLAAIENLPVFEHVVPVDEANDFDLPF